MESQFTDLSVPDPLIKFYYTYKSKSANWTHLMKLVLMVNEYPEAMPLIESLLKDNNEIKKYNDHRYTALMLAVRYSNTFSNNTVVKMLIDSGADIYARTIYGSDVITIAMRYFNTTSNIDTIKILVNKADAVNKKIILIFAAENHIVEMIKMLIDDGTDVNCKGYDGDTPLMYAINFRNMINPINTVKMLISAGANVNSQSSCGSSAVHRCCCSKSIYNVDILNMLINAGSDVNLKDILGRTPLLMIHNYSSEYNDDIFVKMLIDNGADVNHTDNENNTILMNACSNSSINGIEFVKTLIDHGADINRKNVGGYTALAIACKSCSRNNDIIKILIDHGANVNCQDSEGNTLLHFTQNIAIVKLLIECKIDVNMKNNKNQTILMKCLMNGITETDIIVKLIHLSKLTLSDTDKYGNTAYDYYSETCANFLDDYHLKLLKGEISINNTKSAKSCKFIN